MRIMRSFANMTTRDCDGDGQITCDDYSMQHNMGKYGCNVTENIENYKKSEVYQRYSECKKVILDNGRKID